MGRVTPGKTIAPLRVVVQLCHATAEVLAGQVGADLLHIKGAAVAPEVRAAEPLRSTDADVLVRPEHVDRYLGHLRASGWTVETDFAHGSSFEHATTLRHPTWGYLDLHRWWPGFEIDPAAAFDLLWRDRRTTKLAGLDCSVPAVVDQRIILCINAVRDPIHPVDKHPVILRCWSTRPADEQVEIARRVHRLGADLAFSVVTGGLEAHRGDPGYRVWRVASTGGTRREEWLARIAAAPTRGAAIRLALRSPAVNVQSLKVRLGRPPTAWDIVREFFARIVRAGRQELQRR